MSDVSTLATVVIPTYNGEKYLKRILEALRLQDIGHPFEVLVIDSGSTDATLDIVDGFAEVRLHKIPNNEFGHGRTRNLAARLANGTFVAYLTHDAIPSSPSWLRELLQPFGIDNRIVAVMGKQVPRPLCFPLMKYDISGVFAQFGPDFGTTVFYKDDFVTNQAQRDAITFYSDVNSAARRQFLLETIPYQDVPYAEDQMFGRDLIDAGYWKAYAPRAAVEHSNDVTLREFGMRIFDETVGLRRIGTPIGRMTRREQFRYTFRGIVGDSLRICRDTGYSRKRRTYWLAVNPMYHLRKWSSYRRASTVDLDELALIESGSLEHSRKK